MVSKVPLAKNFTNQRVRKAGEVDEGERAENLNEAKIRARVAHVFGAVKRRWGFTTLR